MHDPGDARRVVRSVRLKLSRTQGLLKSELLVHALIDRICLVAVSHDRLISENTDRRINDKARICQLGRIKRLGTDPLSVLHKNTVPAVLASSHDEISCDSLFPIRGFPYNDPSPGIRIVFQFLFDRQHLHRTASPF